MYAYRGLQCWSAQLLAPLTAVDSTVMIGALPASTLAAVLKNGSHTYLVLTAPGLGCEIVKATYGYGVVSIERGQDGTAPRPWPMGSCIEWALTGAGVSELAFQQACCPAECVVASMVSGATLPDGVAGVFWSHRIVISGTPPFALGMVSIPSWMSITLDAGEIRLEGTPPAAGAFDVTIPLKNCGELRDFFRACLYVVAQETVPV